MSAQVRNSVYGFVVWHKSDCFMWHYALLLSWFTFWYGGVKIYFPLSSVLHFAYSPGFSSDRYSLAILVNNIDPGMEGEVQLIYGPSSTKSGRMALVPSAALFAFVFASSHTWIIWICLACCSVRHSCTQKNCQWHSGVIIGYCWDWGKSVWYYLDVSDNGSQCRA